MPTTSTNTTTRPNFRAPQKAMGWRANMLWLVLINGLVLTAASFFLLRLFVDQGIALNRQHQHNEIVQSLAVQSNAIGTKLASMSLLLNDNDDFTALEKYVGQLKQSNMLPSLTYLFWWPKIDDIGNPGHLVYGDYQTGMALMPTIKQKAKTFISTDLANKPTWIIGLAETKTSDLQHEALPEGNWLRVRSEPVAIISPTTHVDGRDGYLVAVLGAQNLVNVDMLAQNPYIERLILNIKNNDTVLDIHPVELTTSPDPADLPTDGKKVINHDVPGLDGILQAHVIIKDDQQSLILGLIPNIVLMFGLLITTLGTLYVYNNQKQSTILTKVNRTLALKNMEMNTQVAERERLNQALRKTERESRAIMNAVSEVIFEVDQNGKLMFLNESWPRVTGHPIDQSLGAIIFNFMADHKTHLHDFEELARGTRAPYRLTTRLKRADGTDRLIELNWSMIRQDDQNNPRVVGTIADIEDRHRAQAALQETEMRYRAIWEHAVTGIYQVNPHGKLMSANPSLARIFGFESPEAMIAEIQNAQEQLFVSPRAHQDLLDQAVNEGQFSNAEIEAKKRDGTIFWILESTRVVKDDQGNVLYFEGSIDDIDERKQAEGALKDAMRESEIANRSKTEFLANMSHELRTPLNAIIGFSEIIKDEVFGDLGSKQYLDYARDIHDSGKSLLTIINTILDVARIEAGERHLNETNVNMPALATSVIDFIKPRAESGGLAVTLNVPEPMPKLWVEELAFKQILLNLLTNAVKFTPYGGQITVTLARDTNGDARLSVTDTGVGLDAEEIERVMAPFGQASGSFARTSTGAGLGLTLVNSLIRLHGGHFELVSQKGIGTTATVVIAATRVDRA